MSREIKFRAWSKKHNRYLKITGVEYVDDKIAGVFVVDCVLAGIPNVIFLEPEDAVLEQYTGLKDKNGKEIYEGDILKDNTDDIDLVNAVFWCENGGFWGLKPRSPFADRDWGWFIDRNVEVVGNIHENPELLGGEK